MSNAEYRERCISALLQSGYGFIQAIPGTEKQKLDFLAHKDGNSYAFHFVKSNRSVDASEVESVLNTAESYDCDFAAVVTNSTFTRSARALAEEADVMLWDRDPLTGGPAAWLPYPVRAVLLTCVLLAALLALFFVMRSLYYLLPSTAQSAPVVTAAPELTPDPATPEPSATPAPTATPQSSPTPTPQPGEAWDGNYPSDRVTYIRASVKDLYGNYRSNPEQTAELYNGSYVRISGFVSTIDIDGGSFTIEAAQGANSDENVLCFAVNDEQLRFINALSLRQFVTVWGLCSVTGDGFVLSLHSIGI